MDHFHQFFSKILDLTILHGSFTTFEEERISALKKEFEMIFEEFSKGELRLKQYFDSEKDLKKISAMSEEIFSAMQIVSTLCSELESNINFLIDLISNDFFGMRMANKLQTLRIASMTIGNLNKKYKEAFESKKTIDIVTLDKVSATSLNVNSGNKYFLDK